MDQQRALGVRAARGARVRFLVSLLFYERDPWYVYSGRQKHVCPHDVLGHAAARRERPPLVHGRVRVVACSGAHNYVHTMGMGMGMGMGMDPGRTDSMQPRARAEHWSAGCIEHNG